MVPGAPGEAVNLDEEIKSLKVKVDALLRTMQGGGARGSVEADQDGNAAGERPEEEHICVLHDGRVQVVVVVVQIGNR